MEKCVKHQTTRWVPKHPGPLVQEGLLFSTPTFPHPISSNIQFSPSKVSQIYRYSLKMELSEPSPSSKNILLATRVPG